MRCCRITVDLHPRLTDIRPTCRLLVTCSEPHTRSLRACLALGVHHKRGFDTHGKYKSVLLGMTIIFALILAMAFSKLPL